MIDSFDDSVAAVDGTPACCTGVNMGSWTTTGDTGDRYNARTQHCTRDCAALGDSGGSDNTTPSVLQPLVAVCARELDNAPFVVVVVVVRVATAATAAVVEV